MRFRDIFQKNEVFNHTRQTVVIQIIDLDEIQSLYPLRYPNPEKIRAKPLTV